jgi:formate/nitrite transporter FocA (FNT family)
MRTQQRRVQHGRSLDQIKNGIIAVVAETAQTTARGSLCRYLARAIRHGGHIRIDNVCGAQQPIDLRSRRMSNERSGSTDAATTSDDEHLLDPGSGFSLSGEEQGDVEEKRAPRAAVLHEIVRREGEHELERGLVALAWSSVAAGLSMGFSMVARGVLHRHLPDTPTRFLLENIGYTFGFLLVILARQQLFTENTMTAVLPVMTKPSLAEFGRLLRLWLTVLLGNLVGVALFAYGLLHLQQFDSETQTAFRGIGEELMQDSALQMFTKGILSGWLIAMMVWMLAASEQKIAVIMLTTYVIGICGLTHIVVGSAETLYLVFAGEIGFGDYAFHFALPTLAGNIVGGSFIFALISHAQVRSDVT